MTTKDINKEYTDLIMSYINDGYIINSSTMGGSQGEIACVDLTNENEIIRIFMEKFHDYTQWVDGVKIVVGKSAEKVAPNRFSGFNIIWNNHLDIISESKFYNASSYQNDFYVNHEEAVKAQKIRNDRFKQKEHNYTFESFPESVKHVALCYLRKQPKFKSVKLSDIQYIKHIVYLESGASKYIICAKGKEFIVNRKKGR